MDDHRLDRALTHWATNATGSDTAVARLIAHADGLATISPAPALWSRRVWFLGVGGALAASVALALLVMPAPPVSSPQAATEPVDSFAMLYTPTSDEAYLL